MRASTLSAERVERQADPRFRRGAEREAGADVGRIMGATRNLGQGEDGGAGISGQSLLGIVAGEGPRHRERAGAMARREAGLLLGGAAPAPRAVVLAGL